MKKKLIDRGKVSALHKAGWSQAKIADEMGCSAATICTILKQVSSENKGGLRNDNDA